MHESWTKQPDSGAMVISHQLYEVGFVDGLPAGVPVDLNWQLLLVPPAGQVIAHVERKRMFFKSNHCR